MTVSLSKRLFLGFLGVILATCTLLGGVGLGLLDRIIVSRIQDKVRLDLRSARDIYQEELTSVRETVRISALSFFSEGIEPPDDLSKLAARLDRIAARESLDILTLVGPTGDVICRIKNPGRIAPTPLGEKLFQRVMVEGGVLTERRGLVFTEVLGMAELANESLGLDQRAHIELVPSSYLKTDDRENAKSGMVIVAAAPVFDDHETLLGVLYGGRLLNNSEGITDRIASKIYENETFQGKDVGLATIFLSGIRISTTVRRENGTKALGTLVSDDVYDHVLKNGKIWISRPFAVNNRYVTAYEPIKNMAGEIVGILSIGVLEDRYRGIHRNALMSFFLITVGALGLSAWMCYLFIRSTMKPIGALVKAKEQMAGGNLAQHVDLINAPPEIAKLGEAFNIMARSISERDRQLRDRAQEEIMKSERLAMIGQLAAGVAHEINNPLGSILLLNRLVLNKCPQDSVMLDNTQRIEREVKRCQNIVQGLLEFARQREPKAESVDLNTLLDKTIALVENQSMFHNISVVKRYQPDLPLAVVDRSQIQQVFINIVINAVDAMENWGHPDPDDDLSSGVRHHRDPFCGYRSGDEQGHPGPGFRTVFYHQGCGAQGPGSACPSAIGIIQRHGGTVRVSSQPGARQLLYRRSAENIRRDCQNDHRKRADHR